MIGVNTSNTIGLIEICMCESKWKIAFDFEWAIIAFPFQISAAHFMPKKMQNRIRKKEDKNHI